MKIKRDIVHRWEGNPVIRIEDISNRCNTVFNAACTRFKGEYILLLRVEGLQGYSIFMLARSSDGYHFKLEDEPVMTPSKEEPFAKYEALGIEDPRIVYLEGTYYITYTAYSGYGARIALAKTDDFKTFERIALISEPGNKDGMLFPRKINGRYARFDRPIGYGIGNIWISYSKDLMSWGDSQLVAKIRPSKWDSFRIGASAPPFETKQGWVEIYHGVKMSSAGPIYRLGVILLDKDNPSKMIARGDIPILSPREYYERVGDINNVVFSSGAIVEDIGEVKIYYGAADTCICVGTVSVDELIECCSVVQ